MTLRKHSNLTEIGDNVILEDLQKIISVQIVIDHAEEKIIYFLESGRSLRLNQKQIRDKPWQELELIATILKVTNSITSRWSAFINNLIQLK